MAKNQIWSVYNVGPGSASPLFTGSKTECLRFMAWVLSNERKSLTIRPV